MRRHKKPATVWLERVEGAKFYEIRTCKSGWLLTDGFWDANYLQRFCAKKFERVTGIYLEPGEVVKVRITVEEA